MPYQWMATGPSLRATGSIWGYISMPGIVLQARGSGGRLRSARCRQPPARKLDEALQRRIRRRRPCQTGFAARYRLGLLARDEAVDDARPLELAHTVGHPGKAQPGGN